MGQPSTGHAGLSREGKTSSGLQPILSSALFRTLFFFVWWKADCRGGKHPARRGGVWFCPGFQIWGWREGEVKAETLSRRHRPQAAPVRPHLLLIGIFPLQPGRQPFTGQSLRRQGRRGRPFSLLQGEIGTRHFISHYLNVYYVTDFPMHYNKTITF